MGLIKVPLFRILPLFILSKIRQIGTLEDYIHFYITVYGNSSYVLYGAHLEYGKCFSLKIAVAGIQPLAVRRLLNTTDVRYKA